MGNAERNRHNLQLSARHRFLYGHPSGKPGVLSQYVSFGKRTPDSIPVHRNGKSRHGLPE